MSHERSIRILLVEDDLNDAELIAHELSRSGLQYHMQRVDTEEQMRAALHTLLPDVIIADYLLPAFSGIDALEVARESGPDIPFILVTGTQSDEVAVEVLKRGASDYLLKNSLVRLPAAIRQALEKEEAKQRQRKAEAAVIEAVERYRRFFEDDLSGDFLMSPDGKLLDCNPAFAAIFGFETPAEAIKANPLALHPNAQIQRTLLDELRTRKKLKHLELEMKAVDGRTIHIIANLVGYFNEDGALSAIQGYFFDNTERKRLEQQLLQAQKMESIGLFVSGLWHDFNNILNNIIGFTHQLKKYPHDQEKVLKYGKTIESSALRGTELANQLLTFVRSGERKDEVIEIPLLVEEVTALCRETFPATIDVKSNIVGQIPPVRGSRSELYQALLNLCVNARDAMELAGASNGGHTLLVEVRSQLIPGAAGSGFLPHASSGGYFVEMSVADTGIGMSEEVMNKIFDPFFTTKERGKGTGLGLSVVYNIVRNHRGAITVRSERGRGSSFHVFLPAVREPADRSAKTEREAEEVPIAVSSHNGQVVLLVDDEEPMLELGRELLEEETFHVLVARDGLEAVEIYRQRHQEIALVILDLVMPRMDGGETYLELKKINPNVRAFFCTGYSPSEMITSLLAEESLKALQKPFKPKEFIKLVLEVLAEPRPLATASAC